ncbi:ATP-binding protein [Algibacter sp. L4_22]|uniref:ATP-binding protein n=1 Tax=Algibacter sp. L4_22 TaxID=2942477 RepID=UPI00201B72F8|nr:ATP-binding protein [Algibacter sp. L4_22]MCL5127124.1 ATP-binding protein [Algibacter sp. L4_22]
MKLRISERKKAKIKIALQGSSGSGKTYSSLLVAKGLTEGEFSKVAIIDTENGSADLYAHLGDYKVLSMKGPYSPEKYIEAISICEEAGIEVIIIDSISHCWDFLLDVHSNMPGNSFTNWGKITPRQNAFINKILQSNTHVIATMRVKQDYVLNQKNGKFVPEKVGLKAIQRNDLDYEFTIVLDVDINHSVKASKDRTGLFIDKPEFIVNASTGTKILKWCNHGNLKVDKVILSEIENCKTIEQLRCVYFKYPDLQSLIKPLILKKQQQLVVLQSQVVSNPEIINQSNTQKHGVDNSKQFK